ncbi:hypothetical protein ACTXT7_014902 [Hymenolepis weldensis]
MESKYTFQFEQIEFICDDHNLTLSNVTQMENPEISTLPLKVFPLPLLQPLRIHNQRMGQRIKFNRLPKREFLLRN